MMRRFLGLFAAVLCVAGLSCATAEKATTNTAAKVAVVAIGDVPGDLAQHARDWAANNLALKIDLLPPQKLEGKNLDDIAAQAVKAGGGRLHVVAIAMPPEGINSHGMRTADKRAAVVNVRPMNEDKPAEAVLHKRIERQVIRAITLLIDVETCPNPQCSLAKYASLAELDQTGRNLCPPCLQKFQRKCQADHLDLDKDSPFFLGN